MTHPAALSPQDMDRKLDEHFAFEAADNVEGVLATLAPDATHDIVGYPTGPTRGRDRARAFYQQLFADLAESRVTPLRRLYGHNFMVDESMWEGKAPGRPFVRIVTSEATFPISSASFRAKSPFPMTATFLPR